MARVISTTTVGVAPSGDTAPDSITLGDGSIWVEYGNGAPSTGGGTSTVVRYSYSGAVEATYAVNGLADGLKYDPVTGNVWVLNNQDANANIQFINPTTGKLSDPLSYALPYVYGANSGRGFDDVVFDGQRVFLSETNPVSPGDPVVQELLNGTAPFGPLQLTGIVSLGDEGIDLTTGKLAPLPVTDPDSLKALPDGSLLLTGEADGAYIFVKHPGTPEQSTSFVQLPAGYTPDDAIVPNATSGTFLIANQGADTIVRAEVTGLVKSDLYADIPSKNELVQIDPNTGAITVVLSGLNSPHGLSFVPSSPTTTPPRIAPPPVDPTAPAAVTNVHILATAPAGASLPDSITLGDGAIWVEYGNGASSTGGTTSTVVEYSRIGQVLHTYTVAGLADGLKYNQQTGDVWVLNNNDGNPSLQLINPATDTISSPLTYATSPQGPNSGRGFDDAVFQGRTVYLSETNPANPGDPVVVRLNNGTAPSGTLTTTPILKFGDTGTNILTGKTETLPINDPDSLKALPDGSLMLTAGDDSALVFIKAAGSTHQSVSFLSLPAGDAPDDVIMPNATSGTFLIGNQKANNILQVTVNNLKPGDLYADLTSKNELVQIDPSTGSITPILTGLASPHGLVFIPSSEQFAPHPNQYF